MTGDPSSTSSSVGASAVVVLAAALVSIGLFVTVSRTGSEKRSRFARQIAAVIIIVAIVAAGAGAYLALSPSSSSSSTTTVSNFVPQATVVRPAISVIANNSATSGPMISVTPLTASVGQNITVNGAGFQPNTQLPLSFSTREGDNILGFKLVALPLRNVTTTSSGTFSFSMPAPATLGGLHYISAGNLTRNSNGTLFIQRTASINATDRPAACTPSLWNATPASRARCGDFGNGWMVPSSLLACMMVISTVSGRNARRTSSGSTTPEEPTEDIGHGNAFTLQLGAGSSAPRDARWRW